MKLQTIEALAFGRMMAGKEDPYEGLPIDVSNEESILRPSDEEFRKSLEKLEEKQINNWRRHYEDYDYWCDFVDV